MCHKHSDQSTDRAVTLTRYICKYWWDKGLDGKLILHPSLEAAENDHDHRSCGIVEVQVTLTRVVCIGEESLEPDGYQDRDYYEEGDS